MEKQAAVDLDEVIRRGAVPFIDLEINQCFRTIGPDGQPEPGLNRKQAGRRNAVATFPPGAGSPFGSQSSWSAEPWLLVYPIREEEQEQIKP